MLKSFSVENFKGFKEKLVFDLGSPYNYGFHTDIIDRGCVTKGIIYGINGSGKSNLGLAIFDIIFHLTDKKKIEGIYTPYLNMDGRKSYSEFKYVFLLEDREVVYRYGKTGTNSLMFEHLFIDDREVIYYDYFQNEGFTLLKGSETLNASIKKESPISRVKYVSNNAILAENAENRVFEKFIDFVNNMLLFFSLDQRGFEGFQTEIQSIEEGIIESGKVRDFQDFLAKNDINYDLYDVEIDGKPRIFCHFDHADTDFFNIASTGTRSLALFYYWYIKMEQASFVFIDEFDAFYHFELSADIIRRIRDIKGVQIITTTHNTDLMSNDLLRPDCYFIIDDNKIKHLPALTEKELRKAHNLQKMYKAGAFHGEV